MAITRLSNSGIKTGGVLKYDTALAGYPPVMAAPTATDAGTGTSVNVAFTAVSGATSYTAISTPGSFTATGASSPLTVTGLSSGTAYTFQVRATNAVGTGAYSAPSNSVTPVVPFSFESIATATGTGANQTITFSSIPQTYKHLQLRISARRTGSGSSNSFIAMQINGDTGNNYTNTFVQATSGASPAIQVFQDNVNTVMYGNRGVTGGSSTSGLYAVMIVDILNYTSTTNNKTFRMLSGVQTNTSASTNQITLGTGTPLLTSAITSITFSLDPGNGWAFQTGSSFALYGIRG